MAPLRNFALNQMYTSMSFEEAKRRFKDEQKAKQLRKGPKLH
ncbi:hypothetical protein AAK873_11225 [Heminiphilus faecis]|uniref:Uncharacterized protein n=1 Tax=Heminiphilus faecis TaxID=2601703 RepID=A0ABV4CXN7_9BACT|nr:hypothetical protein [Heminiphilus faecis]